MKIESNSNKSANNLKVLHPKIDFKYQHHDRLVLPLMGSFEVVKFDDILYCSADSNYVNVHTVDGDKITLAKTLKWVERQLNEKFIRSHSGYLINLLMVKRYRAKEGILEMQGDAKIPVSKSMKKGLVKYFR